MKEIWLVILSGIGNAFQYLFTLTISIFVAYMTYDLVLQGKLNSETFALVAGAIIGGSFGALNPRGQRDKQELWNGRDRRREKIGSGNEGGE